MSASRLLRGLVVAASVATSVAPLAGAQVPSEVRGRVTDATTARPIADALIDVSGRAAAARSDVDGTFVLRGLEPRDYVLRVRAVGFVGIERTVEVANGRAIVLDIALDRVPAALNAVVVRAVRDSQAAGASTFDRAAIEASGRRDVGELLQTVPGVVVTQAGGPGSASHVSIRGSSANEVLVLVDGVPLNSQITGEADLSRVALETIDRVVVHTGAQSARFGGRALAGVVEISTRRATRETSASVRDGSWGERQGTITLGDARYVGAMRASASVTGDYRRIDGDFPYAVPDVRGGGTARRVNADVTARQLLGAFGLESESTAVRMRASWANLERGLAGSIVQPSLTGRETSARAAAGADLRVVRHGVTWTGAADLTRERLTFVDPAPPFGVAYDDAVTARGATMNGGATTRIGPITAAVGGELRTIDVVSTMLAPGAPRRQRLVGAWASSRYTHAFDVDTRIDIDAGARIDESSLDGAAAVSPRATVGLTRGHLGASATIANGYSPPALADQFFHEGVLVRANPALRPERTTGDLEARVALRDIDAGPISISGHASAFRANVDGMIVWLPDFRFVWSPSNVAVDRRGFEASGRLSLFRDAVALQGTLNHTAVTYAGPVLSGQVAYRPAATASTSASARVAGGRVEVTHRFVSARRTVPGSALNALDPYWLTDARWTMPVRLGRWQTDVGVGLENAFDRPAAMLVDYPFPGRTWSVSLRMRHSPLS